MESLEPRRLLFDPTSLAAVDVVDLPDQGPLAANHADVLPTTPQRLTTSGASGAAATMDYVIHVVFDGFRPDAVTTLGAAELPTSSLSGPLKDSGVGRNERSAVPARLMLGGRKMPELRRWRSLLPAYNFFAGL
jgi:hypothetical protein